MADASVFLMLKADQIELPFWVNIGSGEDISIRELALAIKEIVGFQGEIEFDVSKPDGPVRKLLDVNLINQLGWKSQTELLAGLRKSYSFFQSAVQI